MTAFFRRLKFAFWTFFAILFRNHVPDEVAAALGAAPGATGPRAAAASPAAAESRAAAGEPTATEVLAVLQRDGRLVDFLMEDIAAYTDAQIGAAVREVHAGCRQSLGRHVALAPVLDGEEGSTVTVDAGADAALVKVIGNVAGRPPFAGVLRHRGWRVRGFDLPALPPGGRFVVAPAEVEVP